MRGVISSSSVTLSQTLIFISFLPSLSLPPSLKPITTIAELRTGQPSSADSVAKETTSLVTRLGTFVLLGLDPTEPPPLCRMRRWGWERGRKGRGEE